MSRGHYGAYLNRRQPQNDSQGDVFIRRYTGNRTWHQPSIRIRRASSWRYSTYSNRKTLCDSEIGRSGVVAYRRQSTGSIVSPTSPSPGVAPRPMTPKNRPVEVRDGDGRLLHVVDDRAAAEIVARDLGRWRGAREIRLNDSLRHNGFARTWYGSSKSEQIRPTTYAHNQRTCQSWTPSIPIVRERTEATTGAHR
jgi:hypothetical protein